MSLSSIQFSARTYFASRIALRAESLGVRIFHSHPQSALTHTHSNMHLFFNWTLYMFRTHRCLKHSTHCFCDSVLSTFQCCVVSFHSLSSSHRYRTQALFLCASLLILMTVKFARFITHIQTNIASQTVIFHLNLNWNDWRHTLFLSFRWFAFFPLFHRLFALLSVRRYSINQLLPNLMV